MDQILRTPTPDEKKEFIDISTPLHRAKSVETLFKDKFKEVEAEYTKNREPFDSPCAIIDFEDRLERAKAELARRSESRESVGDTINVEIGDLHRYGDKKRMDLVATKESEEDKLVDGIRTRVLTNYVEYWKCKERKHSIKVFIPVTIYDERYPKKSREEEKPKK